MIRYEWVDSDKKSVRRYDEDGITRVSIWISDGLDEYNPDYICFKEWLDSGNIIDNYPINETEG